ncbi:MAG: alpha-ribazole phosphatase [Peptococcaceae bacterium]|nr:alpha-ribazole phosphatase [Peptococcaceae bacterium]
MGCKLFLVRHGETLWNHAMKYQGHTDVPLSERGVIQAQRLARRLRNEKFAAIYASDLQRTYETARILAEPHGIDIETSPALREICFGAWEGLSRDEIKERFPDLSKRWWSSPLTTRLPQGETLGEVAARAINFLLAVARQHQDRQVLVVSHGGTIRASISALLGLDLNEYWRLRQDNVALNILEVFDDERAMLILFNDTAHLYYNDI